MAQKVTRIEKEFIFRDLIERGTEIEVRVAKLMFKGLLQKGDKYLELKTLGPDPDHRAIGHQTRVYFTFRGQLMTFRSTLLDIKEGVFVLAMPEDLYRNLTRIYERISAPKGLIVSFLTQNRTVRMDYPDTERFEPVTPPVENPGFDPSRITELLETYRVRASDFASESKIVMFRGRKPETLPERVMCAAGKFLIVPVAVMEDNAEALGAWADMVVGLDDLIEIEAADDLSDPVEQLNAIGQAHKEKGIGFEVYCPVVYYQYIVAYLYLLCPVGVAIDAGIMEFMYQFSRILAYSLQINGYFKGEEKPPVPEEAQLIDISAGGVLFAYPVKGPTIPLYSDLDLEIRLKTLQIKTRGRVVRKFKDKGQIYIGVQFTEIKEEDIRSLYRKLYGKEYDPENLKERVVSPENDM
jgi:hypothetical protein